MAPLANARIPYTSCPLCEGTSWSVARVASCAGHALYHPGIPTEMRWLRCGTCCHLFTDGYFSPEAYELIFSRSNTDQQVAADFERQRDISARIIEKVLPYAKDGAWLDVGFGNASLLFTAEEYGFTAVGVDLRARNVSDLQACGFEAHAVPVESLDMPARFSVVSMCDVLEHMAFPKAALTAAHKLLRTGGVLLLSMPNLDATVWKLTDAAQQNPYWGELEHHHNFGRRRLTAVLSELGFEVLRYAVSVRYRIGMELFAQRV